MHRFLLVLLVAMIGSVRPCRADPAPEVPAPEMPAPEVPAPERYTLTLGDILRANLERSYVAFPIGLTGLELSALRSVSSRARSSIRNGAATTSGGTT